MDILKKAQNDTAKLVAKLERQPSKLYAIKSFRASIKKLETIGLITDDEAKQLKTTANKITEKYMNE